MFLKIREVEERGTYFLGHYWLPL